MHGARRLRSALGAAWLVMVVVVGLNGSARAQWISGDPDLAAQDSTYTPRYRFSPVFKNQIVADVSSVAMANNFGTSLMTPWGSFFDFAISDEEKNYRLQNRLEQTKVMRLTELHTFSTFWNGSATYSDSRIFNRSIAVGGGVQDFIINDQQVNLGSTYRRIRDDVRTDLTGSAGAIRSERTFKNDRGAQAGVNGGVAYDIGDRITVLGRGALRGTSDQSQTADSTFTGLGSSEDSLGAAIRFQAADSIRFDASHRTYNGDRDFADQARGSLGGQTGNANDIFEEHEKRNWRNTSLAMNSRIFRRLTFQLKASHDEQVFDYAIQTTRYSRTVGDAVSGNIAYTLPWRTVTTVQFENNSIFRDLGVQSIASFTDKKKRVALSANHQFTKTFSLSLNGSSQLQQSFYLRYDENPRDRDQVDTNVSLRINSQPFKKISANITLGYTISEFINIDASQSANNRTRELWELRPSFTYVVRPNLTVIQVYGLSFDYTDYQFDPDQNYLDRNITFSNEFRFRPVKSVAIVFEYALHRHDSGSYLPDPDTGERLLDVSNEDRRDRSRIRVDYTVTKNIGFFAENLFSQRLAWTPGNFDNRDVTSDGQITVGTSANYDWGGGRGLRVTVAKVKRFSPYGADAEKNYWDARSEFSYPF